MCPEGLTASCRTDVSNTLAQNCHCEFCCGMHRTCKNTSIKPDRNGSVKGPERYQGAASAIASVGAKLKLLEKKFKWSSCRFLASPVATNKTLIWQKCRYVWMANPDTPLCDLASLNWVSPRVPSSPANWNETDKNWDLEAKGIPCKLKWNWQKQRPRSQVIKG